MKSKLSFPLFMLLLVFVFALTACQSGNPTAETHQVPTVEESSVENDQPTNGSVVSLAENANLGSYLVDEKGMSLYMFLNDAPGTSNCYETCATNWPPMLTEGEPVAAEGVDASLLGSTERTDGSIQVTYNDWPLYYWIEDGTAGDINGQGVGDVWFVIAQDGEIVMNAAVTPSITVSDHEIKDSMVNITEVISDGAGWVVIHAQADGKPGPILGFKSVEGGVNSDVTVEIDASKATETLYAMLHMDGGEVGTFEFPDGPDGPVMVDKKVITPSFTVTGLAIVEAVPSVTVMDQEIADNSIKIAEVVSDGAGWLVVHAQADGKPGPILGFVSVADGLNSDVVIEIDGASATDTLYAMLHMDGGEVGRFEFPDGPDGPVMIEEKPVTPPFKVLAKEMSGKDEEVAIFLSSNDELGPFLTDTDGMTLYIFAKDEPGISNCYDQCAVNWPPLLLEEGQTPIGSDELIAEFGTTERTDGTIQVTYNDWPLYYWINDAAVGDTSGQGVGGVWAVAGVEPAVFSIVPGESNVAYEVGETFLGDNRFATAIGVTPQIEGKIMGDLANPRSVVLGPVEVDISQFKSDSDRRDNKIRSDFLQSSQFPIATFKPTEIEGIPGEYNDGEPVSLQITGDLTIKETTQPVTFEVTTQLAGETLTGEATTTILMSDFGVGPISILGFLETEDEVNLSFDFVAKP